MATYRREKQNKTEQARLETAARAPSTHDGRYGEIWGICYFYNLKL